MIRKSHAVGTGIMRACCVVGVAALAAVAMAQTPGTEFTYQGRLDNGGIPANGPHDMRFRLFLHESDPDSPLGPVVCKDGVALNDGLFTTQIDFGENVFIGFPLWLKIEARADATPDNCDSGAFTPLTPRQPLKPTPYAVFATTAGTAGLKLPFSGTANMGGALLTLENMRTTGTTHTGIFWNRSPGDNSRAFSGLSVAGSGLTYGVYGLSNSTGGVGVHGESFGLAGVRGHASNTVGVNYGGHFESAGGNGFGVFGHATAPSGANYGVYGRSDSPTGHGIHGYTTSSSGVNSAIYGRTDSTNGRAVFGEATATSGTTYGGRFHSVATNGYGVFGRAGAASGTTYGVYGESYSSSGYGVYGKGADSGVGVYGVASGGAIFNSSIAVYGEVVDGTPLFSYAGFFDGDVRVTQSLTVNDDFAVGGTKSFKIDHPLDPANKYLLHYCTEAPEPLNVYRGNVALDGAGEAWVDLPDYFQAINRDVSYTLTPIGAAAPNLHVAHELEGNRFQIAGGQPGQKVSWRVEAVRDDAWVRAHGAPVEVEKHESQRGKYQHPELYGQPAEMGIGHNARNKIAKCQPTED